MLGRLIFTVGASVLLLMLVPNMMVDRLVFAAVGGRLLFSARKKPCVEVK